MQPMVKCGAADYLYNNNQLGNRAQMGNCEGCDGQNVNKRSEIYITSKTRHSMEISRDTQQTHEMKVRKNKSLTEAGVTGPFEIDNSRQEKKSLADRATNPDEEDNSENFGKIYRNSNNQILKANKRRGSLNTSAQLFSSGLSETESTHISREDRKYRANQRGEEKSAAQEAVMGKNSRITTISQEEENEEQNYARIYRDSNNRIKKASLGRRNTADLEMPQQTSMNSSRRRNSEEVSIGEIRMETRFF